MNASDGGTETQISDGDFCRFPQRIEFDLPRIGGIRYPLPRRSSLPYIPLPCIGIVADLADLAVQGNFELSNGLRSGPFVSRHGGENLQYGSRQPSNRFRNGSELQQAFLPRLFVSRDFRHCGIYLVDGEIEIR